MPPWNIAQDAAGARPTWAPRAGLLPLLRRGAPVDPRVVRPLCCILFLIYGGLTVARVAIEGLPRATVAPRTVVILYALFGIAWGPRLHFRGLRAYTMGVGLLLPLATLYVTAVEGYPVERVSLTVIATSIGLSFLLTAQDLLAVAVALLIGAATVMRLEPPLGFPVANLWSQLVGGIASGIASGGFLIAARTASHESLQRWLRIYRRERWLRELTESAASVVSLAPLLEVLAERFHATLPEGVCLVFVDDQDRQSWALWDATGARPIPTSLPPGLIALGREGIAAPGPTVRRTLSIADQAQLGELSFVPAAMVLLPLGAYVRGAIVLLSGSALPDDPEAETTWSAMAQHASVAVTHAYAWEQLEAQEARARHLAEERAQLADMKTRFITQASHDFRTPLAVIRAASDALARYDDRLDPAQRQQRLDRIQTSVTQITGLLDGVLVLGQAEAGRLPCVREAVDLAALCDQVLADVAATAHESHELLATCAPDRLIGQIDPKLLQRVLINLVGNAVKYSPAGGRVQLEATRDQDGVVFRVSDHGVGIPASDLPTLFEPFHRGGNVGAIDGSGLGLAITQKAVEAHGGTITVQSTVGRGTTFVVSIPDPAG